MAMRTWIVPAALSVVMACSGSDDNNDDTSTNPSGNATTGATGDPTPTTGDSAPGTDTDDDPTGDDPTGDNPSPAVPEVPVRRLTGFEYRNTVQDLFPTMTVPELGLPVDDLREGFDNSAVALIPTKLLIDRYNGAAETIANMAVANLADVVACTPDQDPNCSHTFVAEFGRRAFRRPLTAEEQQDFHQFFESAPGNADFSAGVELTLQLLLQAPQFLYRVELRDVGDGPLVPLDPYQSATRLSYFLWGSMPDEALLTAAATGQLNSPEGLVNEAKRMLDDPRSERAFLHFHRLWSDLDRIDQVTKPPEANFDNATRAAMREEFERFVRDIIFYEDGGLEDLLVSSRTFINDRLAEFYGVAGPGPDQWAEVELDSQQRSGLFTQLAFLAGHGHPLNPSPVKRGDYLLRNLFCTDVGAPPPIAEAMQSPKPQPGMTNRQVYEEITKAESCYGCHQIINPLGFAFEHYDTLGVFRAQDNGLDVDASGKFSNLEFGDAIELMDQIASDPGVQNCITRKWLLYAMGGDQLVPEMLKDTADEFAANDHKLRALMLAIVGHPRFSSYRSTP